MPARTETRTNPSFVLRGIKDTVFEEVGEVHKGRLECKLIVRWAQRPIPELGPEDVLVEVKCTGICEFPLNAPRASALLVLTECARCGDPGGSDVHCESQYRADRLRSVHSFNSYVLRSSTRTHRRLCPQGGE